jgi:hypothetical protein
MSVPAIEYANGIASAQTPSNEKVSDEQISFATTQVVL